MIPLGSCTMKLNATSEMIPITWPEFAQHPSVRAGRAARGLCTDGRAAARVAVRRPPATPASACSPMPARRANTPGCWRSRPGTRRAARRHRNVCLIPESAHGTNPASAQMVGMQVVAVKCDALGNVDLADLAAKCKQHSAEPGRDHDHLPEHVRRVRPARQGVVRAGARARRARVRGRRQHERAGRPGRAGRVRRRREPPQPAQDLLHPARRRRPRRRARCAWSKTWCPSCPATPAAPAASRPSAPVSAAPLGNAGVLPISWMYVRMMGADGPDRRDRDRDPRRQLRRRAPGRRTTTSTTAARSRRSRAAASRTSASSTCAR